MKGNNSEYFYGRYKIRRKTCHRCYKEECILCLARKTGLSMQRWPRVGRFLQELRPYYVHCRRYTTKLLFAVNKH